MNLIPGISVITDQNGNYLAGTAGQVPATVNAAGQATSTYAMQVTGGLGPTGLVTPFSVDATGAAVIRNSLAVTVSYAPTAAVNTTANAGKSMLSVYNGTSNMYLRLLSLYMMCPPQQAVSGGLLQTSTSYTTVGCQIARFTGAHTGGTVIAGSLHDTRDSLDTGFTCRTGATIPTTSATALRVFDASYSSIVGYGKREDAGLKVYTAGPGEGFTATILSAVGGSGVNFYVTAVIAVNTA